MFPIIFPSLVAYYLYEKVDYGEGHNHGDENGRADGNDDDGRNHLQSGHEELVHRLRDGVVHDVHVLGEPVDDPAEGRRVEEGHRRAHYVGQHVRVEQPTGSYRPESQD